MIVLGLDPGTRNPALAVLHRRPQGWHLLDCPVFNSDEQALSWLAGNDFLEIGLTCIVAEEVSWSLFAAEHQGFGSGRIIEMVGALRFLAKQLRVPFVRIAPKTWRKAVAGNGRATKEQVREWVERQVTGLPKRRLGLNRSDAIAIALAGARMPGRRS